MVKATTNMPVRVVLGGPFLAACETRFARKQMLEMTDSTKSLANHRGGYSNFLR